ELCRAFPSDGQSGSYDGFRRQPPRFNSYRSRCCGRRQQNRTPDATEMSKTCRHLLRVGVGNRSESRRDGRGSDTVSSAREVSADSFIASRWLADSIAGVKLGIRSEEHTSELQSLT